MDQLERELLRVWAAAEVVTAERLDPDETAELADVVAGHAFEVALEFRRLANADAAIRHLEGTVDVENGVIQARDWQQRITIHVDLPQSLNLVSQLMLALDDLWPGTKVDVSGTEVPSWYVHVRGQREG